MSRAADVVLKERRRLVLTPREVPLHSGHCKLLYEVSMLGAVIAPPMPAFYNQPQTIDDLINHSVGRVLDLFDIEPIGLKRWKGTRLLGSATTRGNVAGIRHADTDKTSL